jgi:hypothetical protein
MFDRGKLIGETYGFPLDGCDEIPVGCPRDPRSIYCYSNTILGKYQHQGYGRILKAAFIGRVARDFHRIYGHAPARSSTNPSVPASAPSARTGTPPAKTTASTFSPSAIPRRRSGFTAQVVLCLRHAILPA